MTDEAKLTKLEKDLAKAREKLNKRRAELREEDLERRKKEFDKLPLHERRIREALGWSPYQYGQIIRRECGSITVKE